MRIIKWLLACVGAVAVTIFILLPAMLFWLVVPGLQFNPPMKFHVGQQVWLGPQAIPGVIKAIEPVYTIEVREARVALEADGQWYETGWRTRCIAAELSTKPPEALRPPRDLRNLPRSQPTEGNYYDQ